MIGRAVSAFCRACEWAVSEIRSDARRTILALVGISLSCLALTSIASLTLHLHNIVSRSEQDNNRRILAIVNRDALDRASEDDFFSALKASVERINGVARAIPRIILPYRLDMDATRLSPPELIVGVNFNHFPQNAFAVQSNVELPSNAVIIGADVAAVEDFKIDEPVSLYGNFFHVAGILRKQFTIDDQSMFISISAAHSLFPQIRSHTALKEFESPLAFTALDVELDRTNGEALILARINDITNLSAHDPRSEIGAMKSALGILNAISFGTIAITMLCGFAGIANVMLSAINERRREIGIRRALGASRKQIFMEVLFEGVLLGICSSAGGVLLALLAAVLLFPSEREIGATGLFSVSPIAAGIAVGITILCSAGAGLFPAYEAAALAPASALRAA